MSTLVPISKIRKGNMQIRNFIHAGIIIWIMNNSEKMIQKNVKNKKSFPKCI